METIVPKPERGKITEGSSPVGGWGKPAKALRGDRRTVDTGVGTVTQPRDQKEMTDSR